MTGTVSSCPQGVFRQATFGGQVYVFRPRPSRITVLTASYLASLQFLRWPHTRHFAAGCRTGISSSDSGSVLPDFLGNGQYIGTKGIGVLDLDPLAVASGRRRHTVAVPAALLRSAGNRPKLQAVPVIDPPCGFPKTCDRTQLPRILSGSGRRPGRRRVGPAVAGRLAQATNASTPRRPAMLHRLDGSVPPRAA